MTEIRHKILHREIEARPLLREALTQDPALAHHVAALDRFLVALAMDLPDGWLAERVIGRCLPSNQTILEEKQRRVEATACSGRPHHYAEVYRETPGQAATPVTVCTRCGEPPA